MRMERRRRRGGGMSHKTLVTGMRVKNLDGPRTPDSGRSSQLRHQFETVIYGPPDVIRRLPYVVGIRRLASRGGAGFVLDSQVPLATSANSLSAYRAYAWPYRCLSGWRHGRFRGQLPSRSRQIPGLPGNLSNTRNRAAPSGYCRRTCGRSLTASTQTKEFSTG